MDSFHYRMLKSAVRVHGPWHMEREDGLVSLVYLVCCVCLVEPDRPDEPDQPSPVSLVSRDHSAG